MHLDATKNLDEPELPFAAVEAESSILSTANRDIPLLRLDGKDEAEDFTDRIHWAGRKVAYDRIQTYRRDEVHQNGVPPKIYNRELVHRLLAHGRVAHSRKRQSSARETDPSEASWKLDRDDFKLAPGSPTAETGPDLDRIPAAPVEGDR